jgi:flagellar basal-body rod protein FlgF
MADGIYVSMTGAAARTAQLDAIADNLANAQTPGFKASRPSFEAFLARGGASDRAYAAAVGTALDLRPGPSSRTDNALDVLPDDGAYLAVQLPGGERAYTRDGRLAVDAARRLVQNGHPVLDRSGAAITLPPGVVPRVAEDGTVLAGGDPVGALALFRLDGPMSRSGHALLQPAPGGRAEPTAARVRSGEVELGNSGPLEGMVQLVTAQRQFDASMQALQTYRTMDGRSSELGRVK